MSYLDPQTSGGGASVSSIWRFNTAITASDPGAKLFKFDNATLANVTNVYINSESNNKGDLNTILSILNAGDQIYVQQAADADRAVLLQVSSAPVDNTGWWTIPVTVIGSATIMQSNAECAVLMVFGGSDPGHTHDELVAGATQATRFDELSAEVLETVQFTQGITAFAGGGQTNATLLGSSYNLVETVTTTGDSLKLPEVFDAGTIVRVKMLFGGPNPANIFPFEGDNLGQGVDQPIQLEVHKSLVFIGLTANSVWNTLYAENELGATFVLATSTSGPSIPDSPSSATVPTLIPSRNDLNTGVAHGGDDRLNLVAGGVVGLGIRESAGGVFQLPAADLTITANPGGGVGSATVMANSYNLITVCATPGDSVRLTTSHDPTSIVTIKNLTANACDIFPASSQNLGLGVDTAHSLAAGAVIQFISTVASSNWEEMFEVL